MFVVQVQGQGAARGGAFRSQGLCSLEAAQVYRAFLPLPDGANEIMGLHAHLILIRPHLVKP